MCIALTENSLLQNMAMLISDGIYMYKTMFEITQLLNASKRKFQSTSNFPAFRFHVLSFLDHKFLQRLQDPVSW